MRGHSPQRYPAYTLPCHRSCWQAQGFILHNGTHKIKKQSLHNMLSAMVSLSHGEDNMPKLCLEQFYTTVFYCKTAKAYPNRNCLSASVFCILCSTAGLVTATSSTTNVPTTLPHCPLTPVQSKAGVYLPHLRKATHTRILRPFHEPPWTKQ